MKKDLLYDLKLKLGIELRDQGVAMPWTTLIFTRIKTEEQAKLVLNYLISIRDKVVEVEDAINTIINLIEEAN